MQQPQTHSQPQRPVVLVSSVQRGNPVLKCLRQVAWRYANIEPDFIVGTAAAALYISVQYHLLHPTYLKSRLVSLDGKFRIRILLVHVDVDDSQSAMHALTKLAFAEKWSLVCAWSRQEVARYIETFKLYEHKPADLIQGRTDDDYASKLIGCLTAVRSVNKTDVSTLASTFGTLKDVMTAPPHEIKLCPGIGELKATRLADTFHAPFLIKKTKPGTTTAATSLAEQLQPIAVQTAPMPSASCNAASGAVAAAASPPLGRHQLVQKLLDEYAQLGLAAEPAKLHPNTCYNSNAGGNLRIDMQAHSASDCDAVVLHLGACSNLACVMVSGETGLKQWEALQQSLPPPAPVYVQPSGTIVIVS